MALSHDGPWVPWMSDLKSPLTLPTALRGAQVQVPPPPPREQVQLLGGSVVVATQVPTRALALPFLHCPPGPDRDPTSCANSLDVGPLSQTSF